jgi:hypothetical protein
MLDTGIARQNADPCQANNPNELAHIPQMLIRKHGDPECVSFNGSILLFHKLQLISMLLHDAATKTPNIRSMTSGRRDANLAGVWMRV